MTVKRAWIAFVLGGIAVLGIVGAGTYAFLASRRLAPMPEPSASRNRIAVDVQMPGDGASFPANGTLPISVGLNSEHGVQVVQFWLDGELLTDVVPPEGARSVSLDLPADILTGDQVHTLVAVAMDEDGRSSPGNAVRLTGIPAVEAEFILTTQGGESLASIAGLFGQPVPRVLQANTRLLVSGRVQTETEALPPGLLVSVPLGEPPSPEPSTPGGAMHQVSISPDLPAPPSASISAQGCEVTIALTAPSDRADGYSVYRLDPDRAAFTRLEDLSAPDGNGAWRFIDTNAYGQPQYFIAAYNDLGETSGPLTQVAFTDPECLRPSDLSISDGILHLPADIERAYLYAAINAGEYNRWPRTQSEFVIPQDGMLDLHPLTDSVVDAEQGAQYPLDLDLEVWGWAGGELRFLGVATARLDDTRLAICNLDGGCTGDVGSTHYVDAAVVGSDADDQSRELRWTSSLANNPTVLLQVSLHPFAPAYQAEPEGLVYSELVTGQGSPNGSGGTFSIDFGNLRQAIVELTAPSAQAQADLAGLSPLVIEQESQPSLQPWLGGHLGWAEALDADFLDLELETSSIGSVVVNLPKVYYVRTVPVEGNQPSGPVSNSVRVEYRRLGPAPTVELYNDIPPAAYEVSIQGFTPPTPPWLHWGCVDIVAVDESSSVWTMGYWATMKDDFLEARDKGWAYCPTGWRGQGEASWYEQLWDFIQDGSSWLSEAYEDIKNGVVDAVASGLNAIPPGDLCGESCKSWLKAGLEAGLAALGIPPSLPDVNKLTDEGIAYLVEEGARQIGVDCGETCQELLTEQLHSLKDQMLDRQVTSYGSADEAHAHGYNPLPLPPDGLTVAPSLGNSWQLAYATLTLTRTPDGAGLSADELRKYDYRIDVGIRGYNEWMVGRYISVATAICYNDASMWPCDYISDLVTEPLEGSLFGAGIPVPDLAPGQSMDVQVVLLPNRWWYADHEKYAGNTWEWYDEWWHLYDHGQGRVTATIYAQGVHVGGPETFTISQAGPWEFDLPLIDLQGMNAP